MFLGDWLAWNLVVVDRRGGGSRALGELHLSPGPQGKSGLPGNTLSFELELVATVPGPWTLILMFPRLSEKSPPVPLRVSSKTYCLASLKEQNPKAVHKFPPPP